MIYCCPTTIFKWHTHLLSNFIDFSIFHACARLFWVITTTWGCHPPPSTGHLSLHHLLALCHAHPTLPSPWVTPKVNSCAHTCLFWALPPIPSRFPLTFPLIHGWGAVKHPTHLGPMLLP